MTPREEMKQLLERVAEMALDNVDKYGFHIPLCLAHSPAGEDVIFVADDLDALESPDPPDEDKSLDPEACVRSISYQVRRFIAEGKLRAVALAMHVTCTLRSDEGRRQAPAVKMWLDHEAGGGYTAYLTYRVEEGKAVPEEILYQDLGERFFPTREGQS
ncbi:MAG: hypothetical protein L0Z62_00845 [Gemmataceae bacterium]|nr:hypothetical protein [Gemmataceae bacterium]